MLDPCEGDSDSNQEDDVSLGADSTGKDGSSDTDTEVNYTIYCMVPMSVLFPCFTETLTVSNSFRLALHKRISTLLHRRVAQPFLSFANVP